jgi:alpha-beta hydrolase superfamily lysophospholipase
LKHNDGWLDLRHSAARGTSHLYTQSWQPDDNARAAILLVHGLGEHSGRYAYLAKHCTDRGFAVHTLDHYGHGKSDGQRGFVERFSVYIDGVRALLERVQRDRPDLPLFLVGHSMGGLIGAAFLLEAQAEFRAGALSGPALRTPDAPSRLLRFVNRVLSVLAPTAPLIGLDPAGVSRDPEVVRAYVSDPLVHHGKLSARLLAEMLAAMDDTLRRASEISLPLLILHGEQDQLTCPSGSRDFHERVMSADKVLKIYPELYHEIFNEPEKDAVLTDLTDWLENQL